MKPLLHTTRNMYDRVAHFSFGLLLSYPLQEMFMRKAGVRRPLALRAAGGGDSLLQRDLRNDGGRRGDGPHARNAARSSSGMQGDMWDSQEDMFMAGIGSVVAVILLAVIRHRRAARAAKAELELAGVWPLNRGRVTASVYCTIGLAGRQPFRETYLHAGMDTQVRGRSR